MIQVDVNWGNAKHPLVGKAKVELTEPAKLLRTRPGQARYSVPLGARVQLAVEIGAHYRVDQSIIIRATAPEIELVPSPAFGQRPDPRVNVEKRRINIDTSFVDVTRDRWKGKAQIAWEAWSSAASRHKAKLRVIDHTPEPRTLTSLVVVPEAAQRERVHALIFLAPTNQKPYRDGSNVDESVRAYGRYFIAWRSGRPTFVDGERNWKLHREVGLLDQLAESRKPVVLVFPIPHGSAYDAAERGSGIRSFLEGMVRCLHASKVIDKPSVALGKIALAGFSWGGGRALNIIRDRAGAREVSELYLMDPATWDANVLRGWLRRDKKTLRMIAGGIQQANMFRLQAAIGRDRGTRSSHSSVDPSSYEFWQDSPEYQLAASDDVPSKGLVPVGASAEVDSASTQLGLRVVPDPPRARRTTLTLRGMDAQKRPFEARSPRALSAGEAAGVVRFDASDADLLVPVVSKAQLMNLFKKIESWVDEDGKRKREGRIREMRHAWSLQGGIHDGTGFKGWLRWCLELSELD